MEARILLQKIRQRGFTVKPLGNRLFLAPKQLITDQILLFFQKNKQKLLAALYEEQDEHKKKKSNLGHRVGTLQLCLKRHYGGLWKDEPQFWLKLNKWLDQILYAWNYDLEGAIAHYNSLAPEPTYICQCGNRAPFCTCGGDHPPGVVTCAGCVNFEPDAIGDGAGIGLCKKGIPWTEEAGSKVALFAYARRRCREFEGREPKMENKEIKNTHLYHNNLFQLYHSTIVPEHFDHTYFCPYCYQLSYIDRGRRFQCWNTDYGECGAEQDFRDGKRNEEYEKIKNELIADKNNLFKSFRNCLKTYKGTVKN